MPQLVADIVDVYVFRRMNARVQFLLLQRRREVTLGNTWQSFHSQAMKDETAIDAARRAVKSLVGLTISAVYSADYINQFYDDQRDAVVLAPVLAVNVHPQSPVRLGEDFRDCAWFDRDEATIRLPFTGQRWAVRHVDEIMSIGEAESELYRLSLPALPEGQAVAEYPGTPAEAVAVPDQDAPDEDVSRASEHDVEDSSTDVPMVGNEKL